MMPYTYPNERNCRVHGCMYESQPYVGDGTFCFGHAQEVIDQNYDLVQSDLDDLALGSCGCTDYHMADCPLRTG